MLDVLHVTESLSQGGAEQNLLSILSRLPRDRYRNHLAWLYPTQDLLDSFRPAVASLVPLGAAGRSELGGATMTLWRWLRVNKPDVVHVQLLSAQLVARVAAMCAGHVPVITTWQNTAHSERSISDFGSPLRRQVVRWLDAMTGRYDAHFIAVSDHVAQHCAGQLGIARDRVSVIHNCVEPCRYEPIPLEEIARTRAALDIADEDRPIIAVGRLIDQKAHTQLLAAMPAILRRVPRAVLLIAGGGPLAAELRARASALSLGDRVRILGRRNDVPTLLAIAELFAFPSLYEGLSVALVEALSTGLPAVVSDIPQNREVADGLPSVRFVARGDVELLASAIADTLDDRAALREHAMAARADLRARFSPELLARRFSETIDEVVARGRH